MCSQRKKRSRYNITSTVGHICRVWHKSFCTLASPCAARERDFHSLRRLERPLEGSAGTPFGDFLRRLTPPGRTCGPAARVPGRRCDLHSPRPSDTEKGPVRRPEVAPGCRLDLCRPLPCGAGAARPGCPTAHRLRPRLSAAGRSAAHHPPNGLFRPPQGTFCSQE